MSIYLWKLVVCFIKTKFKNIIFLNKTNLILIILYFQSNTVINNSKIYLFFTLYIHFLFNIIYNLLKEINIIILKLLYHVILYFLLQKNNKNSTYIKGELEL